MASCRDGFDWILCKVKMKMDGMRRKRRVRCWNRGVEDDGGIEDSRLGEK